MVRIFLSFLSFNFSFVFWSQNYLFVHVWRSWHGLLTVQDNPSTNNTFRVPSRLYWLSILYIIIEWLDLDWSYTKMNTYVLNWASIRDPWIQPSHALVTHHRANENLLLWVLDRLEMAKYNDNETLWVHFGWVWF